MKMAQLLATLCLGATLMTPANFALAAPDAASDPRIDPQVRSFLDKINKDSSPVLGAAPAQAAADPDRPAE